MAPARPTVTVIGLGPAGPELTTLAAREALSTLRPLFVRTSRHPAAAPLLDEGAIALDHHYDEAESFEAAYRAIAEEVAAAALSKGGCAYAVPGSPRVLERSVRLVEEDPRVQVAVVEGMSFLELCWGRLGVDPVASSVRLVDGESFETEAARERGPLLVGQLWNEASLGAVKLAVPDSDAEAVVLSHLGLADEAVTETTVGALDRVVPDHLTCLYLPRLAAPVGVELARLEETVALLRRRCPWDAAQTHASLVRHLLEECYEAAEALDELGEPPALERSEHVEEELGDVLCQVLFHCVLAEEEGLFTLADVARTLREKLVRRHPHVFVTPSDELSVEAVLTQWEARKRDEKGRRSLMEGIPAALPALVLATKLERKAAGVGLGLDATPAPAGPASTAVGVAEGAGPDEFGVLLFELARLAAGRGIDPEQALRRAATAFRRRFVAAEEAASASGEGLAAASPERRLRIWAETQGV